MRGFIEMKTERLLLRPLNMNDLVTTHAYAGNLENTRFMMFLPTESLEETEKLIGYCLDQWPKAEPARLEFAVMLGDKHIGSITLYFEGSRDDGELGWVLHRDYWGHGYVTEAARAMIAYAKNIWKVKRVFACCDSENVASYKVMEKLGMRRVSCTPGRKNRSCEGERLELRYEISVE